MSEKYFCIRCSEELDEYDVYWALKKTFFGLKKDMEARCKLHSEYGKIMNEVIEELGLK